jgi:hypothetical protein
LGWVSSGRDGYFCHIDIWKQVTGGENRFSEVAGDDFFRLTHGSEVHPSVPVN